MWRPKRPFQIETIIRWYEWWWFYTTFYLFRNGRYEFSRFMYMHESQSTTISTWVTSVSTLTHKSSTSNGYCNRSALDAFCGMHSGIFCSLVVGANSSWQQNCYQRVRSVCSARQLMTYLLFTYKLSRVVSITIYRGRLKYAENGWYGVRYHCNYTHCSLHCRVCYRLTDH